MVSRKPHPAELRERAVQMAFGLRAETGEARGSIARVGHGLGINTETLRNWVNKAEVDSGQRPGSTTGDQKRIAELERKTVSCGGRMRS
jgi:transposase